MHIPIVKTKKVQSSALWLIGVIVAGALLLLPTPAQAATAGWGPWHFFGGGGPVLPGFWVTGEVDTVEEGSITVTLPNPRHERGMMRHLNLQVTLDVVSSTVLLDGDLAPMSLDSLEAGDEVVVAPGLVWGNLVARLLYMGNSEDLADAGYSGRLVEVDGDTLTLGSRRDEEFTVVVDDNTIWYDNGQVERPADLPDDLPLRLLGIEEEDDEGNDVIRAVLITQGHGF